MFPQPHRRLLNPDRLAARLGYSRTWLAANRARLEAAGMPPPVIEADELGPALWDERAIDLWLDSHMPQWARAASMAPPESAKVARIDTAATAELLRQRARELAL